MREDEVEKSYILERGRESAQQERVDSRQTSLHGVSKSAKHKLRNIDRRVLLPRDEIFVFQ